MPTSRRILYKIALALCAVVAVVAGIGVTSLSITQRGIAVGVSIDWVQNAYRVGVQFVQPGDSNAPGSASVYEVVQGTGDTLHTALDDVVQKTSQYPSYAHCKVLFVGDNLLDERLDEVMRILLVSNTLGSVQVVAVEGMGYDSLTAHVPILETASAYMEKENKLVNELGGRTLVSIKDYCQRIDDGGTKYLPYARQVPAEKPLGGPDADTQAPVLFDINNTVAADENDQMHIYGSDITHSVGLIEGKSGFITAYTPDGRYVTVQIRAIRASRRYRANTVMGTYRYTVSVLEQSLSTEDPSASEVEALVADAIEQKLDWAYRTCMADGVDIFSVCGHLYKRYGVRVPLAEAQWQRTIRVKCR